MHSHQADPAVKPRTQPTRQLVILPEAALRHLPVELFLQPLVPPFRLRLFLAALLAPRFDEQRLARLRVVFQLADGRHLFTALLNDMQGKGMEGSGGNIPGMQTFLDPFVHLLGCLAAKSQQQNLVGYRLARRQKPAGSRHQHRRFTATGARQHQHRLLAVDHGARLGRIER